MISIDVDTAVVVPVNVMPLLDDTDFKTRETTVAYDAAGMDLVWNFVTSAGVVTQTAVTPTTAGDYDWAHAGDGMYTIEIPASGGASINNDTEGYGYFTGVCDGVLPWRGPTIQFRAAALNDALCDGGDNLDVDLVNAPNATALAAIRTEMDNNSTQLAAIVADTNELQTDWANGGRLDLIIDELTTNVDAVETDTQDIQSRLPAALVNSRMDCTIDGTGMESGAITAIWTTALTEAYRSTGAAGTAAELLHEILQNLTEFAISSTTKTVKKFDGSTTAKTYTLDDATNPTSITEAT